MCTTTTLEITHSYSSRIVGWLIAPVTPSSCCIIGPDLRLPNSPDLNPVDYKIWGVMQQRVYERRMNNVDELKQSLIAVWDGMQQNVIDSAVDEWRKRLRACVRAEGPQFEHFL